MYKFAIILLTIFSISMADACEKVACTRSNALAEIDSFMNEIKPRYDKVRADYMTYNEPALIEAAQHNKTYHDEIIAEFVRGEDALIIPAMHVFPECRIIYEEMLPYKALMEEIVNNCISDWRRRNADYLNTLDGHEASFKNDIDGLKSVITEIGKDWLNGIEIEIESQEVIDRIKKETKSRIESIREKIRDDLVKPNWETNTQVKPEIDACIKHRNLEKLRQTISDMIKTIDNCVSDKKKRYSYRN